MKPEHLVEMKDAGADRIGVAIDGATPEIFDRLRGSSVKGPHRWETYWGIYETSLEVFGEGMAGVHLICGLGETEEEMVKLRKMLNKIKTKEPPRQLEYRMKPDFWVQLKYVVEVAYDDITRSPTHTCGLREGKGYALRFPRLLRIRDDKSPKEATTTDEVIEMYNEMHKK